MFSCSIFEVWLKECSAHIQLIEVDNKLEAEFAIWFEAYVSELKIILIK